MPVNDGDKVSILLRDSILWLENCKLVGTGLDNLQFEDADGNTHIIPWDRVAEVVKKKEAQP